MTAVQRRALFDRPLTPEEISFAEAHQRIIWRFLRARSLEPSEWYGVVAIRYLQTVKRWHTEPRLRAYSFVTIVWNAMRSSVGNEQRKAKHRPKTVSLNAVIPGTDGLTLEDILYDRKELP